MKSHYSFITCLSLLAEGCENRARGPLYQTKPVPNLVKLHQLHGKSHLKTRSFFRNIYAPHGAKFRFIFSVEAKPVLSK